MNSVPQSLHKRLQEQIDRHFGGLAAVPETWLPFLQDINRCYAKVDENAADEQIQQVGQALMRSTADLIFLKDETFRYLLSNPANNAFMGKTEEEIIGHTDFDLMPREPAENCRTSDQRTLDKNHWIMTEELIGKKTYEVLKFPVPLSNGHTGVGAVIRNITLSRKLQRSLEQINKGLLELGLDSAENIRRLTRICGEQLGADCALYNRLHHRMLCTAGQWHVPSGYSSEDLPEGHICFDVIREERREPLVIRHLLDSSYARTDPNVAQYALQTYWGQAVRCGNKTVGSLCVVFRDDREASAEDLRILGILASFISQEEEHLQADEALRESEERMRSIFMASPDGIAVLDMNNRVCLNSPGIPSLFGYPQGTDFSGRLATDFLIPENRERATRNLMLLFEDQQHGPIEYQGLRADGSVFDIEINGHVISSDGMPARQALLIVRDITKRKQAESSLLQSEQNHRTYLRYSPYGIFVTDQNGRFLQVNPAACRITGYTEEELIGKDITDLEFEESLEDALGHFHTLLKSGRAKGDLPFRPKNGEHRWWHISAVKISDTRLLGFCNDITERKQAESALRKSETQLTSAQEMTHSGHWEYDVASDTFTFNDNFYRIFKTTAAQAGGYQMSSKEYARRFCHPDDMALVAKETRAAIQSPDPNYHRQIEHRIFYADGTIGHIAVRFSIVKDSRGRTIKTYGVNQDITAYKQTEEALRESRQITQGIIDSIPVRVFWKNKSLKYLGCNKAFAKDVGLFDPQDIVGKDDTNLNWKSQAGLIQKADREVICSGTPRLLYEMERNSPEGKTFILLCSKIPMRDAKGQVTGVLGAYMDVTQHREAEQRLQQNLTLQQAIAANIPGAVYQLQFQPTGFPTVTYMSSGCERLFEHPLKGLNYTALWFDHMPPDDLASFRHSINQAARDMQRWSMEFRVLRPGGGIKWLRGSANPRKDSKGRILWNGVLLDITERKQAEEEVTKQLNELLRWQRATLGREERIMELKREVNALAARLNRPPPYPSTAKEP